MNMTQECRNCGIPTLSGDFCTVECERAHRYRRWIRWQQGRCALWLFGSALWMLVLVWFLHRIGAL